MKDLLELKEKTESEIKNLEDVLSKNNFNNNYTSKIVMRHKLENKKDLLKIINIIYHMK